MTGIFGCQVSYSLRYLTTLQILVWAFRRKRTVLTPANNPNYPQNNREGKKNERVPDTLN